MAHGNAIRKNFVGMSRKCSRCENEIIVTEQMCKHGVYVCKPCLVKSSKEYVERNREKKRKWNLDYSKRNSDKFFKKNKEYKEKYSDKKMAHQKVQTALRNGSLMRKLCEICNSEKAHAHHEDYSSPLDVIWLCHRHHMERHKMLAEREK